MITRFKNLMLSSLEESALEWRISNVIRLRCLKVSFTIKSWRKLKKSKVSRILINRTKTTFNAESAGVLKKTKITHWLLHANVEVLLVLSISNALRIGFSLKNKKNLQIPKIRMFVLFTGSVLSVKSASKCTHTHSRYRGRSIRSLTYRSSSPLLTTTFF